MGKGIYGEQTVGNKSAINCAEFIKKPHSTERKLGRSSGGQFLF